MARTRRRTTEGAPARLILDSGAVIALARSDDRARAHLAAAWEHGAEVVVPAMVLAETLRGGAGDAPVHRILRAVGDVAVVDGPVGRSAGELLGATGEGPTIDALVVATAVHLGGGTILTSDPGDLGRLAEAEPTVQIVPL